MLRLSKYAAALALALILFGVLDAVISARSKQAFDPDKFIVEKAALNPSGRFQLVQLGSARADQLLLDTADGRVWRATCVARGSGIGNCSRIEWQPDAVIGLQ